MEDKKSAVVQLGFTKLVVEDIDKMSAFYGSCVRADRRGACR